MRRTLGMALLLTLPSAGFAQDKAIPGIGPVGKITKVDQKFEFTEGPAADADGNVYFRDIPAEKIYKIDTKGMLTTVITISTSVIKAEKPRKRPSTISNRSTGLVTMV